MKRNGHPSTISMPKVLVAASLSCQVETVTDESRNHLSGRQATKLAVVYRHACIIAEINTFSSDVYYYPWTGHDLDLLCWLSRYGFSLL